MTRENPAVQPEGTAALVARLRAEQAAQEDKALQALLLHECGVLEENNGEEPAAARDYLAAFNADPQFREPLESLVRILTRRKSVKNLGKLLDALARAAVTSEERSRALWERASYLLAHEQNVAGARELLEQAIGESPEDPTIWLELELCAAKEGDAAGRMRALEARAELASDPTWKALLYVDLAELCAASGDTGRAYELLGTAAALEGKARFRTQLVLEAVAAKEDNVEALSRALEGQADLIEEAIEDGARGDDTGVPRFMRKPEYAADAWLRAAFVKAKMSDGEGMRAMLERASDRLPESSVITRARLSALEAAGDVAAAAELAKKELARGATGPGAAALWLKVADAASDEKDAALDAIRNALQFDAASIPARALEIDLLSESRDAAGLASSIEAIAASVRSEGAKGRALLVASFVWGAEAGDVAGAKKALAEAKAHGVPAAVTARAARMLAALRGETVWFEESTRELLASGVEPAEEPGLWFELGRSLLLRGDDEGASAAFGKLAACDPEGGSAAWLGRALAAYALGLGEEPVPVDEEGAEPKPKAPRSPEAIEDLAKVEPEPQLSRALWLVAALRSARAGQADRALSRLVDLHQAAPGDPVTGIFCAELARASGEAGPRRAAEILATTAKESEDGELAAALYIEAALSFYRAGDRARAIAELDAANEHAPRAVATVLAWALRGADPDNVEGRRRAIDASAEAGADPTVIALERFGLEAAAGEGGDILGPLEAVESGGDGDVANAAAIARLLWPSALEQRASVDRAIDRLDDEGGDARSIARAERLRIARTLDQDRALAASRAASWSEAEERLAPAIEWLAAALAAEDRTAEVHARREASRYLGGAARAAMEASAAMVALLDQPMTPQGFIQSNEPPAQLMNLELAPPGCDPRRRAAALHGLSGALGDDAKIDAVALAGWSELAAGKPEEARTSFSSVVELRPKDIASWEGIRAASEALGDHVQEALALAQLGALCKDDERGAGFWERAGVLLLEHTDAKDDAEIAFERAFERDAQRSIAFDKLFRAVRARNEDDKLLAIIERRLDVSEDEAEIGKMYWERARVLRKKGDLDGALSALENVTMLEPDHVGALALLGQVYITKSMFAEAAPYLAKLATIAEAPSQQRLMSGIAAVDLYENKLGQPDKALDVLLGLHKSGLSTLAVRERVARVAARAGAWGEATSILETLMNERDKREGRIEAARLGMAIWRDKLGVPVRAEAAVTKLLDEAPDDGEAIDFILATPFEQGFKVRTLGRARQTLVGSLARNPVDPDRVELLAKIAAFGGDQGLRQATLGSLVALGKNTDERSAELLQLDRRVAAQPQIALDAAALAEIADPEDHGPMAELFVQLAETVMLALGPSLVSLGVTKKDRVEARGGHPLRVAVAEWMGALGFTGDFDLYIGGPDPRGVTGIASEQPALVLGSAVTTPFDAAARSAVAREVFSLKRGINAVRSRDENTVASLVYAACIEAGIAVQPPNFAVFAEVSRSVKKEIPRRVRKAIPEVCQRIVSSGQDPRRWAAAALRSIDRMSVIAAGDVSIVLADALRAPRGELAGLISDSDRARRLLAFVLSPNYLELRKKLGMGVR